MKKIFVISIDALIREDVPYLETKPNFSRIMSSRAEVTHVRTVYPALTYPAHCSIMTGCLPGKHGVIHNSGLKMVDDGFTHFYFHSKTVKAEDLFAQAKRAGLSTAAVFWPITAFNPNIDHNINEYFCFYPGELAHAEETFARQGADEAALRAVRENLGRLPSTRGSGRIDKASLMDDFINGCTCSLIRNEKPDFMMIHNCTMDSSRHRYGAMSERNREALDLMDEWLGEIADAMEEAGVFSETDFVIVSDHGQMDFSQYVHLNTLMAEGGFVDLAPDGTVYDWQAWGKANGFSAAIHLADPEDEALRGKVFAYLQKLMADGRYGIEKIYIHDEVKERYGLSGPFAFMIESDGRSTFTDKWTEPAIQKVLPTDKKFATHGYEPEKGPQPVFMGSGPSFREGAVIDSADVIDIAPTLSRIMGQKMAGADGKCLDVLLRAD
ncbi:MAG: alkaline phosphatase family protein [Lachnospiraceae bacterium]|nr:alkaline phosphatase family protein [Lachnospiraceae bacterium]